MSNVSMGHHDTFGNSGASRGEQKIGDRIWQNRLLFEVAGGLKIACSQNRVLGPPAPQGAQFCSLGQKNKERRLREVEDSFKLWRRFGVNDKGPTSRSQEHGPRPFRRKSAV